MVPHNIMIDCLQSAKWSHHKDALCDCCMCMYVIGIRIGRCVSMFVAMRWIVWCFNCMVGSSVHVNDRGMLILRKRVLVALAVLMVVVILLFCVAVLFSVLRFWLWSMIVSVLSSRVDSWVLRHFTFSWLCSMSHICSLLSPVYRYYCKLASLCCNLMVRVSAVVPLLLSLYDSDTNAKKEQRRNNQSTRTRRNGTSVSALNWMVTIPA
jgi:hypothetical protein